MADASLSYIGATTNTSDAATHTYTDHAIGTADDTRVVIVTVAWRGGGTTNLSSATIAGIPAVRVGNVINAAESNKVAILAAFVPTGTTGTVVLTFEGTINRSRIAVYRAVDCSYLPADVGVSFADDPSYAIDVPAGGFAIGVSCMLGVGITAAWTGLIEDDEASPESIISCSSASKTFSATQTNLTVQCNWTASSTDVGVFASWGPAPAGGGGSTIPNLSGNLQ